MKNIKYLFNFMDIKLLLLLFLSIFAFQLFATSKIQEEVQLNNFDWKNKVDAVLINSSLNIKGNDLIFSDGFELIPIIQTFSANPESINVGESTILTWELSNDAIECIKSGDWSGSLTGNDVANGSHSLTVENINLNSTFSLVCVNSIGSSPTRTVTVLVENGKVDCSKQPSILNGDEDFTIRLIPAASGNQVGTPNNPAPYDGTYMNIVPGTGDWPGVFGTQAFFNLTSNKYIAMQFNTDSRNIIGELSFETSGNGQGPPSTATTVAISECPGDFTTHLNQESCISIGGETPVLLWRQDLSPGSTELTHCKLEKNKMYYLNIVHSNSVSSDYSITSCTSSACGGIFRQTNLTQ